MKKNNIILFLVFGLFGMIQTAQAQSTPTTDVIDYKYIQPKFAPVLGLDVDFIHEKIRIHKTGQKLDLKTANAINDLLLNLQETMHGNLHHPAIKHSIDHDLHQLAGLIGMDTNNHEIMTKFKNDFTNSMNKLIKGIIPNLDTTRLNQLNHDLGLEGNGIDYIVPKYQNGHKIAGEFTTINTYLLSAIDRQYNQYNTAQRKFNESQRQLQISQTYIIGFEQKLVKKIQDIESLDKSYAIHNLGLNEAEKIELKEARKFLNQVKQIINDAIAKSKIPMPKARAIASPRGHVSHAPSTAMMGIKISELRTIIHDLKKVTHDLKSDLHDFEQRHADLQNQIKHLQTIKKALRGIVVFRPNTVQSVAQAHQQTNDQKQYLFHRAMDKNRGLWMRGSVPVNKENNQQKLSIDNKQITVGFDRQTENATNVLGGFITYQQNKDQKISPILKSDLKSYMAGLYVNHYLNNQVYTSLNLIYNLNNYHNTIHHYDVKTVSDFDLNTMNTEIALGYSSSTFHFGWEAYLAHTYLMGFDLNETELKHGGSGIYNNRADVESMVYGNLGLRAYLSTKPISLNYLTWQLYSSGFMERKIYGQDLQAKYHNLGMVHKGVIEKIAKKSYGFNLGSTFKLIDRPNININVDYAVQHYWSNKRKLSLTLNIQS